MKIKNLLAGVVATGALALGSQAAQAGIICQGCEYGDDAGTYLGSYNPTTFDFGTFNHSDVGIDEGPSTAFEDFWVFDLDPGGTGSISADFTAFTAIAGFHGRACMRTTAAPPARAAIARRIDARRPAGDRETDLG